MNRLRYISALRGSWALRWRPQWQRGLCRGFSVSYEGVTVVNDEKSAAKALEVLYSEDVRNR
jgi:hypothetical protein